jgi:Lrp/AsnC family leucine-responsive transcriptional regulator
MRSRHHKICVTSGPGEGGIPGHSLRIRRNFERALLSCEEVMECYLMTGAFDYIVRVVASDMAGTERFVMTWLATIEGVRDPSTSITLRRVHYKTVLPVHESGE